MSGRYGDGAPVGRVSLRPLVQLLPFALRHTGRMAAAVVALLVATAATLAVPLAVRRIIDHGFTDADAALVNKYFATMLVVVAVLAVASAARYYFVTTLGERIVADLRAAVFRHLLTLSAAFYDGARAGELTSRLTADTTQIKAAFGASASIALRNLVLFLGAAAMMVWTSPWLSALVLLALPAIVLPLVAFSRAVRRRSRSAQDALGDAAAFAAETIGAARTVQAFTGEGLAADRFAAAGESAYDAARGAVLARACLTAGIIFLVSTSIVAVLWYGATDVLEGGMTGGTLGQFVLYAVFAAGALGELSQVWGDIAHAAGAAERLGELLVTQPVVRSPAKPLPLPKPVRGAIAFEDVRFSYPAQPQAGVLDGVSFRVAPGETVAIVGPSGAGKSTIFHLLLRFYDPDRGTVRLDGVSLADADLGEVRRNIALVSQEAVVFAGSAADNIALGRPGAGEADIVRAAEFAGADPFLRALPEGYATPIGERGTTLSGGQRQRLALARAVLKDAPVLLLDEATSALDAETETAVQEALKQLTADRTTLVIAHRLATVLAADRILVLDAGRIVDEGTHAELVRRGGLYGRLAELQFRQPETAGAA
jgi:ATP-binding cassette, subfamily B, bacterial